MLMISKLWGHIGLAFRAQAFSWEKQEAPEDREQVAGWHAAVTANSGIRPHNRAQNRQRLDDKATQAPQPRLFGPPPPLLRQTPCLCVSDMTGNIKIRRV